jgi:hypothetical protein
MMGLDSSKPPTFFARRYLLTIVHQHGSTWNGKKMKNILQATGGKKIIPS